MRPTRPARVASLAVSIRRSPVTLAALLFIAALAASSTPPLAAAPTIIAIGSVPSGAKLTVNGKLVAIFRTSNGTLSPVRRAETAAENLKAPLEAGSGAGAVSVRAREADWGVFLGDALVMIATQAEAKERDETPEVVARRWAGNLRAALAGTAGKTTAAKKPTAEAKKPTPANANKLNPAQEKKSAAEVKAPAAQPKNATATPTKPAPTTKKPTPEPKKTSAVDLPGDLEEKRPAPAPVQKPQVTMSVKPKTVATAPPAPKPAPAPPADEPGTLGVSDKDGTLSVPVDETRSVGLKGTARGAISARTDEPNIATVRVVGGSVQVRGENPGRTVVRVGRGTQETAFTVWVKSLAGRMGAVDSPGVTGAMSPGSLVRKAALDAAVAAVKRAPGASVQLAGQIEGVQALARGESAQVLVPLSITGEGLFPVKALARVRVNNVALPEARATTLLYSNDPESVKEHGVLYQGYISREGPGRLLYHHQNRTGAPFAFQLDLLNPNDQPVDVQVIEGEAGPFIDPIQVGHRAAQRYLAAAMQDLGTIVRIPAGGSRTIHATTVPNDDTVSGLYGLRIVQGGALVAQVSATAARYTPAIRAGLVDAARTEPHTYSTTQKDESYVYKCGEHWTFMPLGRKAIVSDGKQRTLFGNYGVIYNLSVEISNPTDTMRTVSVVLSPDAGWTRGVFVIDGKLVESPQIAPPSEAVLYTVQLAPQESRKLSIQGIPVGGSNYPISLVVRS